MLFGNSRGLSIRQLIERALKESPQFKDLKGGALQEKFIAALNKDGKYDVDQFRKPLIDALMRGDYEAAQSLSHLCLLNVAWLDLKDTPSGKLLLYEIKQQLQITDLDSVLPLINTNMANYPTVRKQVNKLIKDGWLIPSGTVTVQACKFSVFLAATAPMVKHYNQPVKETSEV